MPRATFIGLMNTRAAALGMTDTHFVNPIGLDDPGHYTSAADLARASEELIRRCPRAAARGGRPPPTSPPPPPHPPARRCNPPYILSEKSPPPRRPSAGDRATSR